MRLRPLFALVPENSVFPEKITSYDIASGRMEKMGKQK